MGNPHCTLCPLHEHAITVCIGGRGPEQASILIVGQNPGGQEALAGKPFIGPSGAVLNEILAESGLDLNDIRVTNAVRCETLQERAPTPKEVDACRVYLKEEIHATRPSVIIAMGDVALRALTKLSGITSKRGKEYPLHPAFEYQCSVWPTFHPAHILRYPIYKAVVLADLRRIHTRDREEPTLSYCSVWDVPSREYGPVVAWDIETDYNYATKTGGETPTQIAFASNTCIDVSLEPLALAECMFMKHPYLRRPTYVTHNGWQFDVVRMRAHGINAPWGRDTMVLGYLMDENQPLGLEALCVKYLGVKGWKEAKTAELGTEEFKLYNARDAYYTLKLYEHFVEKLGTRMRVADHILLPVKLALEECTKRGLGLNKEAVHQTLLDSAERQRVTRAELQAIVGVETFNPNSTTQVAAHMELLGITLAKTATGKPSTSKASLAKVEHPFIQRLEAYREASKILTTYAKKYDAIANTGDGRVHPTYTYIRTATGRSSAVNPNVQNIPRELQSQWLSDTSADYSAIEFWVAVWCAQEQGVIARRTRGEFDPHTWFASVMYGKSEEEVTKHERQIAKSANFSLLYLGTGETLRDYVQKTAQITLSSREANRIACHWHDAYPGFTTWYHLVQQELKENGYVESATGRRRHFGEYRLMRQTTRNEALRQAVNFKVQSLAFDIAALGLIACYDYELPICGFVHDSIYFNFPSRLEAEANAHRIESCMKIDPIKELKHWFDIDFTVPLGIEIKYQVE
jgi:uracil-DNA glycosylase family 4